MKNKKNKGVLFDPDIVDIIIAQPQDSKDLQKFKKKRILEIFDCKISINEAVEIAKEYAEDGAASFINGVLNNISKLLATNND